MSNTATADFRHHETETRTDQSSEPGFIDRVIATRERQGKAYVRAYLDRQSDASLAGLGFTAEQIASIRRTGDIPASFWR